MSTHPNPHNPHPHTLACQKKNQVRAADRAVAAAISACFLKSHLASGQGEEGADAGMAELVQGWLSSGLSGFLSMGCLLLSWDQCFIQGWHILVPASVRLVLKVHIRRSPLCRNYSIYTRALTLQDVCELRHELQRAAKTGWNECMAVASSAPLHLSSAAVRECFGSDARGGCS